MTKADILKYIKHTPENMNPAILFQFLEEYKDTSEVASGEDLVTALTDEESSEIALTSSVEVDAETQISHSVTIDGCSNTVTTTSEGKVFTLTAGGTIKNITIESEADNTDWHSSYGIQFYNCTGTVKDVTITGCNAAIIVNSSEVTLKGTIDVSGNTFGGIEVSKGSADGLTAGILNINGATLINDTEEYGKPTIWIDGLTDEEGIVNGAENLTQVTVGEQIHYYLNAENAVEPESE